MAELIESTDTLIMGGTSLVVINKSEAAKPPRSELTIAAPIREVLSWTNI